MPTVNLPYQDFLSQPLDRSWLGDLTNDDNLWKVTETVTAAPIDYTSLPLNSGGTTALPLGRITISPFVGAGEAYQMPGGERVMSREAAELLRGLSDPIRPATAAAEPEPPPQVEPPAQRGIRLRE